MSSRKAVVAEAYMLPNMSNPEEVEEYEAWKEWFGNIISPEDVSRVVVAVVANEKKTAILSRIDCALESR
jgi:hypothetical protein